MSYRAELSSRAARDLDRLGRDVQERMLRRLEQLAQDPRVGGWRILFMVNDVERLLNVVTIERRGQVYQRI